MKKEKTIRTYQRRTKTGKVVTVKQHTAKYDAAEALKEAAKKKGAGDELESLKEKPQTKPVKEVAPKDDALGFTADEYKAWYHWDQDADPKNKSALKVEKALKAKMGAKGYKKYFDEMSDSYSSRGHNKAFKALDAEATVPKKDAKTPKSSDSPLKVGSSIQMGNSTSLGKGKKETFKVLAVQKTNKQDRELGNTEAAWVQRKDGSVTLALKDSEKGWMYDDTWTDFTDRKHPYAKSLEAAGYSFKKAQGKGGKYWEVSKGKETKVDSSKSSPMEDAIAKYAAKGYEVDRRDGAAFVSPKRGTMLKIDKKGNVTKTNIKVEPATGFKEKAKESKWAKTAEYGKPPEASWYDPAGVE